MPFESGNIGNVNVDVIPRLEFEIQRAADPHEDHLDPVTILYSIQLIGFHFLLNAKKKVTHLIGQKSQRCDTTASSAREGENKAAHDLCSEQHQGTNDPFPGIDPVQNEQQEERKAQQVCPIKYLCVNTTQFQ